MRYREFTSAELQRRLEDLIADRIYRALSTNKIQHNAIQAGIEKGRAQYVASLMPGREKRQRDFRQRQRKQRPAQADHGQQGVVAPQPSTTPDLSK
jgi:hypothetical protein